MGGQSKERAGCAREDNSREVKVNFQESPLRITCSAAGSPLHSKPANEWGTRRVAGVLQGISLVPPLKGLGGCCCRLPSLERLGYLIPSLGGCAMAVPPLRGSVVLLTSPRADARG